MKIVSKVASVYRNVWRAPGEAFDIHEDDFHPDVHDGVVEPVEPGRSSKPATVDPSERKEELPDAS